MTTVLRGFGLPLLVLLVLLVLLGCTTPAPVVDTEAGLEVRTPAFTLFGNLGEDEMRELAGELALFDAVVRKVTNTRIANDGAPARFYVVREEIQAQQLMSRGAAGQIYPMLDGYESVLAGNHPFWTRAVLLHEYAHYVLRGDRRMAIPRWYDEGLSDFLSYMRLREDVIILGRPATGRLRALARWGPLPLARLFGYDGSRRINGYQFYATAWALLHHLSTSESLNAQLQAFVQRLVRGDDWQAAYDASFEPSLEELEASLAAHIAFIQRGGRRDFGLDLSKVQLPKDFALRPVPPAEIAYRLGDMVRRAVNAYPESVAFDLARARHLLGQAVRADPDHQRARAALAWTYAAEGRLDQALEEIAAAGGDASSDPPVARDRARIAALQSAESGSEAAFADARALLERAIALAPEQPEAHAALAHQLASRGERDAAIAAFERARELGAWSPALDVALARQYREIGARQRAIALLRPVAADLHSSEPAEEARRLLAELGAGG